jgi:CSLREA domain-containing protein
LRSRRGLIRLGAAVAAATLVALAAPAVAPAQQFPGFFTVDRTADEADGECARDCTLREAVDLAGASGQQSSISVRPGVYRLTRGPLVLRNVSIFGAGLSGGFGAGARTTIIDAGGRSRVFEVPSGSNSIVGGVTVTGGTAAAGGGAFVESGGQLIFHNSIISGNVAGGRGGGVMSLGEVVVLNSTVTGNRVDDGNGGGIAGDSGGSVQVQSSTVTGNSATAAGGGIYAAGSLIIAFSTIAGNSAQSGGGLFQESGAPGGIAIWNTIVASGASGGACGGPIATGGFVGGNLSNDSSCQFPPEQGVMNVDPLLAPLANNGGPTDTRALRQGSPAIDAGNAQVCGTTGSDQRRAPFVNNCDIGAFEFGGVPPQTELEPPVAGETVNVSEARGIVKVKLPGSDRFFDLEDAQQVPIGSTFNTNRGRVNLIAAGQQRSWFYEGTFRLGQTHGARPLSTLTLTGALACGKGANIAAKKKRRLWGNGKGKFRTKGKHSAATVVGTRWLVEDRCNGTLTRVVKGRVRVRDFRARRTVVVKAGKRYFARAR